MRRNWALGEFRANLPERTAPALQIASLSESRGYAPDGIAREYRNLAEDHMDALLFEEVDGLLETLSRHLERTLVRPFVGV